MFKVTYKEHATGTVVFSGSAKEIPCIGDKIQLKQGEYCIKSAKFFPEQSNAKVTAVEFELNYAGYLH